MVANFIHLVDLLLGIYLVDNISSKTSQENIKPSFTILAQF